MPDYGIEGPHPRQRSLLRRSVSFAITAIILLGFVRLVTALLRLLGVPV